MRKDVKYAVSFVIFLIAFGIFWWISEPSVIRHIFTNFAGLFYSGLVLLFLPAIVAAFAFNRKLKKGIFVAIVIIIIYTIITMLLETNSEGRGYAIFVIPWELGWSLAGLIIGILARFIGDRLGYN